jgi:hypothetical protein
MSRREPLPSQVPSPSYMGLIQNNVFVLSLIFVFLARYNGGMVRLVGDRAAGADVLDTVTAGCLVG